MILVSGRDKFGSVNICLAGVLVLTFDELLLKLVTLRDLLKDPNATKLAVPTVTIRKLKRRKPGSAGLRRRS